MEKKDITMSTKTLNDLRRPELQQQLQKRNLSYTGNKEQLRQRLIQELEKDGLDPKTFEFQVDDEVSRLNLIMSTMMESLGAKLSESFKTELTSSTRLLETNINSVKDHVDISKSEMMQEINKRVEDLREEFKENIESRVESMESKLKSEITGIDSMVHLELRGLREEINCLKESSRFSSAAGEIRPGTSSSAGKMKPPVFDGQVSWSVYKRQFEAATKANHWTNEEKATALVIALRGQASELLQTIPNQDDYDALVNALELRYGNEHLQEVYRVQLKARQQKSGETLQELEADIERLAHLAYPSAPPEYLDLTVTDAFIDALKDEELKRAIRVSGKRRSSEALVYALSYEAAKDSSKITRHVRSLDLEEGSSEQHLRRVIREELAQERGNKDRRIRCWNCDRPGHIQRDCRAPPRRRQRSHSQDNLYASQQEN